MLIPDKVLHNETQRHVARMAVRNSDHIEDLDILIRSLHENGLWSKLDVLCVVGPDESDSLLDLKGNQDSVKIGTPAFVGDRGFTTVSTTDLIDTQVVLGLEYASNCSMSVYIRNTSVGGASRFIGVRLATGVRMSLLDSTNVVTKDEMQSFGIASASVAGGGFRASSREDTSAARVCGDESVSSALYSASTWFAAVHSVLVGARDNNGVTDSPSPNQYSHWSVGKGMNNAEILAYDNLIKDYMTRRGAAV